MACAAQLSVPQHHYLSESDAGEAKTSSLSICGVNFLCEQLWKAAWDAGDPDNLNLHCHCISSFMKCFSVLAQSLKCETCACDSAVE